ncbi:MAG: hypothetical protein ACRDF4_06915 [Rhabdochlamydiaceae bacterium]
MTELYLSLIGSRPWKPRTHLLSALQPSLLSIQYYSNWKGTIRSDDFVIQPIPKGEPYLMQNASELLERCTKHGIFRWKAVAILDDVISEVISTPHTLLVAYDIPKTFNILFREFLLQKKPVVKFAEFIPFDIKPHCPRGMRAQFRHLVGENDANYSNLHIIRTLFEIFRNEPKEKKSAK